MLVKTRVLRHKTAISRPFLSRPFRIATEENIVNKEVSIFDYGCGLGEDLSRLAEMDFQISGWDPVHFAESKRKKSDIVNLGYVVNVIEDVSERVETLKTAWNLTKKTLIVSARLENEAVNENVTVLNDGILTERNTFQKFFTQNELRDWIDETLNVESVAAAPGIFYIFRNEDDRQSYIISRYRHRRSTPTVRVSDALYSEHKVLLDTLMEFLAGRGRLPAPNELKEYAAIEEAFGSINRAFLVIRRVTGNERWEELRIERLHELLVELALSRFGKRPKFGALPDDMKLDVRDFFSSYKEACAVADELLFTAGNIEIVNDAVQTSPIGKITQDALYIHKDSLFALDPILRIYEGCARRFIGLIDDANLIKLHRKRPRISYLSYPDFDTKPHPELHRSVLVDLRRADADFIDYTQRKNPPVLHRKETFLALEDSRRSLFSKLTLQEEKHGLFENTSLIGTLEGWNKILKLKKLELKGHRLIRLKEKK